LLDGLENKWEASKSLQTRKAFDMSGTLNLLLLMSFWSSWAQAGSVLTRSYDLPNFQAVVISSNVEVDIRSGEEQLIVIKAEKEVLNNLIVKNTGDVLSISCKSCGLGAWPWKEHSAKVKIVVNSVSKISVTGTAKVHGSNLNTDSLTMDLSGAGEASLDGKVKFFDVTISGAGKIKAYELVADRVQAEISGAGVLEVHALKILDADVGGAGRVTYLGTPAVVKTDVSGVGQVKPRG
jgi:hypothetical protein